MSVNTGAMTVFRKGKPIMVDFDAGGSTYNAGDVIVVGATPFVTHEAIPAFTGGSTRDAVAAGGGVYECVTDGTGVIGDEVFWDATNKKVTATAAGNTHFGRMVAGPTLLTSGAGPASDGDLCWVQHDPQGRSPMTLGGAGSEVTQSTTATLTVAQVLSGFINSAPAGAITLTTPTAANLVAGVPGCKVGDRLILTIENTAGGANTITLAGGTGATVRGGLSVAQNKAAFIQIIFTNVTVGTEAYTAHTIISA